nr:probable proline--tRNA ligase, mitochondrial [Osmia lignaria]
MSNIPIRNISKVSKLFQPMTSRISTIKKSEVFSKSYEHLIKYGFIKQVNSGMYAYLPLALRVLNKLTTLVDNEMERIGAQKILLPALTSTHLWKQTDRYNNNKSELFILKDRSNKEYILSPTCEETICNLLSSSGIISSQILPLKLYQISSKWRDEMKPRHGFLRSREFLMKDLYTFDLSLNNALKTYEEVCEAYENIFKNIGLTFVKAVGDPGFIGGSVSHEYHYKSSIGEDVVCICSSCQYAVNKVMCNDTHCPKCKNTLVQEQAIEVGHTFLLNTKYTKPLNVKSRIVDTASPLVMGCYGLGLSRIFTMLAEILSTETELRWPKHLAPYTLSIIPPKKGSKEESANQYVDKVIEILDELNIDAILDDRSDLTIGNRLMHARVTGIPYVIIIGKATQKSPPLFEIHDINNSTQCDLSLDNMYSYFNDEKTSNIIESTKVSKAN